MKLNDFIKENDVEVNGKTYSYQEYWKLIGSSL